MDMSMGKTKGMRDLEAKVQKVSLRSSGGLVLPINLPLLGNELSSLCTAHSVSAKTVSAALEHDFTGPGTANTTSGAVLEVKAYS
jgi:hypothetical protein